MSKTLPPPSQLDEPVWELAELYFPRQGHWTEAEYLALGVNRLIEFDSGTLEFLPKPTPLHQRMLRFLFEVLQQFVRERAHGEVLFAPVPLWVSEEKYREPDLLIVTRDHADWIEDDCVRGADLLAEIVSPGEQNRERDIVIKRAEYAALGVAEYWIIDPESQQVSVLVLRDGVYEQRVARAGDAAVSSILSGFKVAVAQLLAPPR